MRPTSTNRPTCAGSRATPPLACRSFIRLMGGGMVLAAGGTVAATMPDAATQPWRHPGAHADTRRFMLAHALLAPNPHNRQPWIADLRESGVIHLMCDGQQLLPETDPHGRQILIGCGAFLELAVIAGAQQGIKVDAKPLPDGAPTATALPGGTRMATLTLGAPGSAAGACEGSRTLTVLDIDDKELNLLQVEPLLPTPRGLHMPSSSESREGLRLAASDKPDRVLLDIRMPVMVG